MDRTPRRLLAVGTAAAAVLSLSVCMPAAAQAVSGPPQVGAPIATAHPSKGGYCLQHRRPVAIAPRMIDKTSGPARNGRGCR
jgi:hypothetical protein